MAKDKPTGFKCECGKKHTFPMYVYAHWYEPITHTCSECDRQHILNQGRVILSKGEK